VKLLQISGLKKLFQSDESRFLLGTGFKMWSISLIVELLVGYILLNNVRLNYHFFHSHGYRGIDELSDAYFYHVTADIIDAIPWILGFHVIIFFMGLYMGHLMLRPFKRIGTYCTDVIQNSNAVYRVEEFSAYRLLTRFSELFFDHLSAGRKKGSLDKREIPPQFMGVHKPVLDGQFLFHFSFFLIIIMIISIGAIMGFASNIQENTTQIALKMLKADPKIISAYFHDQSFLIDEMWILTALLIVGMHVVLGFHLYSQVSGASFAIFATMRSFMKGSWQNRVHLVGYSYLRDSTRALNKYLDWVEKNLIQNPPNS
jgi:hypothetical protein